MDCSFVAPKDPFILRGDNFMRADIAAQTVDLYRGHLASVTKAMAVDSQTTPKWSYAYEHNGKSLENVLTFKANSYIKILGNIGKNFTDIAKPYKSYFHVSRDFLTPLRSAYQVVKGSLQVISAIPIELFSAITGVIAPGKKSRINILSECSSSFLAREAEGFTGILLGTSLALSTILMPIKLISRGVLTLVHHEPLLVENNRGLKRVLTAAPESEERALSQKYF